MLQSALSQVRHSHDERIKFKKIILRPLGLKLMLKNASDVAIASKCVVWMHMKSGTENPLQSMQVIVWVVKVVLRHVMKRS